MRILGRRPDGALHLGLGGGLSVVMRGGFASPPTDEATITGQGPWYHATSLATAERRQLEGRLDRARTVPLAQLTLRSGIHLADDGMWSCPSCGHENARAIASGCDTCGAGSKPKV